MNLVGVAPWFVCQSLTLCCETGKPFLSLHGSLAHWVGQGEQWQRWQGTEADARELAALYGGEAIPSKWLPPQLARRDWRPQREDPRKPKTHARTRENEEVEPC